MLCDIGCMVEPITGMAQVIDETCSFALCHLERVIGNSSSMCDFAIAGLQDISVHPLFSVISLESCSFACW